MSTYYIAVISSRRSEYLVIKYNIIYEYIYILLDKFKILYYLIPGKKINNKHCLHYIIMM